MNARRAIYIVIVLVALAIYAYAFSEWVAITAAVLPTPTPTATPAPTMCEIDRDATQAALDAYHTEKGDWPTADGGPGDIEWNKLVPNFMEEIPPTDGRCDWQVNSQPEGEVCLWALC